MNAAPTGGPSARTELARIIVAKDIFTGCDESMTAAYGVLLAAARHWATPEQVSLVGAATIFFVFYFSFSLHVHKLMDPLQKEKNGISHIARTLH